MGVLLMLMTIGGTITAAVLLVIAVWAKMAWLRNFVLGGVAVWYAFYLAMLFGASLTSKETTLALNEPKAFCGFYLDCHMHTAVTGVRKTKTIGDRTATGEFYVVEVKVFSDAVRARLNLPTPELIVVDGKGERYSRDLAAENKLGSQPPLDLTLGPEEELVRAVVFDLPAGIDSPRLDIREGYGVDRIIETVLVGDEDSFLHKRNLFKLEEQTVTAAVQ